MSALLDVLERRAEERYGRGSVVIVENVPRVRVVPYGGAAVGVDGSFVRVEVRNPDGGIVLAATHESRTKAICVLLKSFGEEVAF